jgi:hypothetical protein
MLCCRVDSVFSTLLLRFLPGVGEVFERLGAVMKFRLEKLCEHFKGSEEDNCPV